MTDVSRAHRLELCKKAADAAAVFHVALVDAGEFAELADIAGQMRDVADELDTLAAIGTVHGADAARCFMIGLATTVLDLDELEAAR